MVAAWTPRTVDPVTIPVRAGAAVAPGSGSGAPDPLAPLLDLPGVREPRSRPRRDRPPAAHKVLRRESAGVSTESALRGARASAALEGVDVAPGRPARRRRRRPGRAGRAARVGRPRLDGRDVVARARAGAGPAARPGGRRPGRPRRPRPARRRTPARGCPVSSPWSPAPTTAPAVARRRPGARRARRPGPVRHADGARRPRRRPAHRDHPRPRPQGGVGAGGRLRRAGPGGLRRALAGYAAGEPDGVAGWLVHCCRATEHGALEGLAICESLLRG